MPPLITGPGFGNRDTNNVREIVFELFFMGKCNFDENRVGMTRIKINIEGESKFERALPDYCSSLFL